MADVPYEVYDGEGNVIESGTRPMDSQTRRRRQYIADCKDFAVDVRHNPGNYRPSEIVLAKFMWLMYEGIDE